MKEKETIEYLDLKSLVPFRNHPFKLRDGEEKEQLLQSIKTQGAIEPLIVRPLSESEYEVISGHRRLEICKELGMEKIPVIVRNLSDEQAASMMVDANLHRNNILPSERAFAYKMKWEAAKKSEKTLSQPATKYRSDERIANEFGIGKDTLHRQYPALIFQLFPKGSIANFRRTMRTFHPSLKFRMFKGIFPFNVQVLSSLGFVSRLSNAFFSFLNNWKSLFTAQGPCGKDFSAYTGA